jgi:hypothetical protein
MNALFKLRPGLFGLLFAAIALSSFSHAVNRPPRGTPPRPGPVVEAALRPDGETSGETAEQAPEAEQPYTYLQFQIDTDLVNLEQTVRNRAAAHLDQGHTAADLNNLLWELGQDWRATPEQLIQRLALNRALQTLADGEPAPAAGAIVNPTVEAFRDVTAD